MLVKAGRASAEDFLQFGLSFIDLSAEIKSGYEDTWREVLENAMVTPVRRDVAGSPYRVGRGNFFSGSARLIDSSTNTLTETWLADIMLSVFRDRGFVKAIRQGPEDVPAATITSKLIEYALNRPGHFLEIYFTAKQGAYFGTGIIKRDWKYEDRDAEAPMYDVVDDEEVVSSKFVEGLPVYDDVCLECKDLEDFYPDFGYDTIRKMPVVGEGGAITANEARKMVRRGKWNGAAVGRAINAALSEPRRRRSETDWHSGIDRQGDERTHPDFTPMRWYKIYGEMPMLHSDGKRWREFTILNGEIVENKPMRGMSHRFHEIKVQPIKGRFYGLAPAEVAIYHQDFMTGLLNCIAEGTAKSTAGTFVYRKNGGVDTDKLARLNPRVPIGAMDVDAIRELKYTPPLAQAFQFYLWGKQDIGQMGGAPESQQGAPGPDREAATVGSLRYEKGGARMQMQEALIEREFLPDLARGIVEDYREFLTDPAEIEARIGQVEHPFPLSAIHAEYDLKFVGSRQSNSPADEANALERLFQIVGGIPPIAAQFDWKRELGRWMEKRGLDESQFSFASAEQTAVYALLQRALTGGSPSNGNANGATPALPPAGAPPAQMAGRAGV